MPYPTNAPKAKHDMCINKAKPLPTLKLHQLRQTFRQAKDFVKVCAVYSYADAPTPPLARSLCIVGWLEAPNNILKDAHTCTIAVKKLSSSLSTTDRTNSEALAQHLEINRWAVTAPDKYQRCCLLQLTTHHSQVATCRVVYLAQLPTGPCTPSGSPPTYHGMKRRKRRGPCTPPASPQRIQEKESNAIQDEQDVPLWKPPPIEDDQEAAPLWQPPPQNDDNDNVPLWQPPPQDDDNAPLWQPPPPPQEQDDQPSSWQSPFTNKSIPSTTTITSIHTNPHAIASDQFYSNLTRTLDTRAHSCLYHMRALNGWIKATLITELQQQSSNCRHRRRVLDLACGKGGDLTKWIRNGPLETYVGMDVAMGSLQDAAERMLHMQQSNKLPSNATLILADLGSDVPDGHISLLSWSLDDPQFTWRTTPLPTFDVVSIQFAIHYLMDTKERAERFFQTVGACLELDGSLILTTMDARVIYQALGGVGCDWRDNPPTEPLELTFGGGACTLTFQPEILQRIFHDSDPFGLEYTFQLTEGTDHAAGVGDAVHLPEWLTPLPVLEKLANAVGLELDYCVNFHEFVEERKDNTTYASAHASLYAMHVLNRHGSISPNEWNISRLYCAMKFTKKRRHPVVEMTSPTAISPTIKAKLLPQAMVQAKRKYASSWSSLRADEKNHWVEVELRSLADGEQVLKKKGELNK